MSPYFDKEDFVGEAKSLLEASAMLAKIGELCREQEWFFGDYHSMVKQAFERIRRQEIEIDALVQKRDYFFLMADKLTEKLAEKTDLDYGEHDSGNCPWTNALHDANALEAFEISGCGACSDGCTGYGQSACLYGKCIQNLDIFPSDHAETVVPDIAKMYKALLVSREALSVFCSGASIRAISLIDEILSADPEMLAGVGAFFITDAKSSTESDETARTKAYAEGRVDQHNDDMGYIAAYYEICTVLGLSAVDINPKDHHESVVIPKIRELIKRGAK